MTPVDVLTAHQRMDVGSCLCGWSVLGASHSEHQATEITNAGWRIVKTSTCDCGQPDDLHEPGVVIYPAPERIVQEWKP